MLKSVTCLGAVLLIAVPASAQTVRSGIEAWQKGDHSAAVAVWAPLAARGDADAAFNLGQAYRLGKGIAIDLGVVFPDPPFCDAIARTRILFPSPKFDGHMGSCDAQGSNYWLMLARPC